MVNADPWRIFLKSKEHQVLTRVHTGKPKHNKEKKQNKHYHTKFLRIL